jgi:hypothetical protein
LNFCAPYRLPFNGARLNGGEANAGEIRRELFADSLPGLSEVNKQSIRCLTMRVMSEGRTHNYAMAELTWRLPMKTHFSIEGLDRQFLEVDSGDQIPRTATLSGGRSHQISFRLAHRRRRRSGPRPSAGGEGYGMPSGAILSELKLGNHDLEHAFSLGVRRIVCVERHRDLL